MDKTKYHDLNLLDPINSQIMKTIIHYKTEVLNPKLRINMFGGKMKFVVMSSHSSYGNHFLIQLILLAYHWKKKEGNFRICFTHV